MGSPEKQPSVSGLGSLPAHFDVPAWMSLKNKKMTYKIYVELLSHEGKEDHCSECWFRAVEATCGLLALNIPTD